MKFVIFNGANLGFQLAPSFLNQKERQTTQKDRTKEE